MTRRLGRVMAVPLRIGIRAVLFVAAPAALAQSSSGHGGQPLREIAVTFDDLPAVSVAKGDLPSLTLFTDRLLAQFTSRKIPVLGFVNEGKLTVAGEGLEGQAARIALLRKWIEAGFELGNHTYSHRSLNETPIEEFEADVIRGEPATAALLGTRGMKLRYFRHPFLHVGLDLRKRQAFETWLSSRGYAVAPVTIDNDDYIFAAVYAKALRAGDRATGEKVADAYVVYMKTVFEFFEGLSQSLFERPVPQVLLLHANELNGDHGGRVFAHLLSRGYRFEALDHVLEDAVYRSADTYTGRFGISWLHHWEQSMGRPRTGSPDPPRWISEAYEKGRR